MEGSKLGGQQAQALPILLICFVIFVAAVQFNNGRISPLWPELFLAAYPEFEGKKFDQHAHYCDHAMLVIEGQQALANSERIAILGFFGGEGNMFKAFLQSNKMGLSFDISHSAQHDLCTSAGFRLAILCLLHTKPRSNDMVWCSM